MLFLRLLGKALLILAFIALAYDGAREIANPGAGLFLTPVATHLQTHFPQALQAVERFFTSAGLASIWSAAIGPLLALPVSILFGALGAILFLAGYRRPSSEFLGD